MVREIHRAWRAHVTTGNKDQGISAVAAESEATAVPRMPLCPEPFPHRNKNEAPNEINACVARQLTKRKVADSKPAQTAMKTEWDKLTAKGVWDLSSVQERYEVSARARKAGIKAHLGRVFGICVEKGSELQAGNPGRKCKGRFVFQGNLVKDESGRIAMFNQLSSKTRHPRGLRSHGRLRAPTRPLSTAVGRQTGLHASEAGRVHR